MKKDTKDSIIIGIILLIITLLFGWIFEKIDNSSMKDINKKILKASIIALPCLLYVWWIMNNI